MVLVMSILLITTIFYRKVCGQFPRREILQSLYDGYDQSHRPPNQLLFKWFQSFLVDF